MFAVGNEGNLFENSCAFNGYVNSIYTIGITGINSDGAIPSYGEHCAGIMAVTYSKDGVGSKVVGQTWWCYRYHNSTILVVYVSSAEMILAVNYAIKASSLKNISRLEQDLNP